jgi:hypothetical protein
MPLKRKYQDIITINKHLQDLINNTEKNRKYIEKLYLTGIFYL